MQICFAIRAIKIKFFGVKTYDQVRLLPDVFMMYSASASNG